MPPEPRVLYVLGTRTSHGRTVRTAYRGTPGGFEWNADGTLSGRVYGKRGFRDGEAITTSAVAPAQRHATYVITESGSAYLLGEARQDGRLQTDVRRSGRATVKESLLDAFAERGEQPVPSMAGLTWLVGGAEAGGAQAEKVMRSLAITPR